MFTQETEFQATLYVYARAKTQYQIDNLEPGELPYDFHVKDYDYGDEKEVRLCEMVIPVTIPAGIDIRQACIENLKEQIDAKTEKFNKEIAALNDRIDRLALLEHQSASPGSDPEDPYTF